MLEPIELDTAMSPRPLRATITLVMRPGMDVSAATEITTRSEMLKVSQTCKSKPLFEVDGSYTFTVMFC